MSPQNATPRIVLTRFGFVLIALVSALPAARAEGASDSLAAAAADGLVTAGFENVSVGAGDTLTLGYENRRFRHAAEALGAAHAATGRRDLVLVRRLGLVVAAIETSGDSLPEFRVGYPCEWPFPTEPAGPMRSRSAARADLEFGPLVDYRIGQIFNPLEIQVELQPRLRLNPWRGANAQVGIMLPIQSDYPFSEEAPDAGRVRPGRISLDQFGWLPSTALGSVSVGYFGDNRWGLSLGASRPIAQGAWLVDAQFDRTGFVAFTDEGLHYASPHANSGFLGVVYHPGFSDIAIRARVSQYLFGDRGGEVEVRRSLGDLDIGYFVLRTEGLTSYGIRFDIPIPPMERRRNGPLTIAPVSRFAISFRDEGGPFGTSLSGVASREDLLRQLDRPTLTLNRDRYLSKRDGRPTTRAGECEWVSLTGMTGFLNTPWAGVIQDRGFEAGYNYVPRRWTYDHRGTHDNQIFYSTLGFLPHVEASIRWTRIPGYHSFEEIVPDSRLVDIDRMSSARLTLLAPAERRPGLAVGIEDFQGTRRFHSLYAVAGVPAQVLGVPWRASLGYGFRTLDAAHYVLDGTFGAVEAAPVRGIRLQAEYDSEKWNLGLGLSPGFGVRIRAALLNAESLSLGAGWSHPL